MKTHVYNKNNFLGVCRSMIKVNGYNSMALEAVLYIVYQIKSIGNLKACNYVF